MGCLLAAILLQHQTVTYSNPRLIDLSETIPALIAKLKLKLDGPLPEIYPLEAALFGPVEDGQLLRAAFEAFGYSTYIGTKGDPFGKAGVLTVYDRNAAFKGRHVPPSKVIRSALRAVMAQRDALPIAKLLSLGYHFPDRAPYGSVSLPGLKLSKFETSFRDAPQTVTKGVGTPPRGFLSGWVTETEHGYRVNGTWLNLVDPPKEEVWFECPQVAPKKPDFRTKTREFELRFAATDSPKWKVWQAWTVSQHRTGWFDPVKAILRRGHDPKLVAEERTRSPWETVCARLSLKSEQPALLVLDDGWLPNMVDITEKECAWPLSPNCGLANYEVTSSSYSSSKPISVFTSNLEGRSEDEYYSPPRQSLYRAIKKHRGSITQGFPSFGLAGLYADYSHFEAGVIARATDEAVGWSVREWPAVKALSARPTPWLNSGELSGASDHLARYAIDRAYFFTREVMSQTLGRYAGTRKIFTNPESNAFGESRRITFFPADRRVVFSVASSSTPHGLASTIPQTIDEFSDKVALFLYEDPALKLESLLNELRFAVLSEPVMRLQLERTPFFTDVPTTAIAPPKTGFRPFNELPAEVQAETMAAMESAQKRLGRKLIKP